MYYILKNKQPVEATDEECTEFFSDPGARRVAKDEVNGAVDVIKAINMLQGHGVIYLEIREKDKDDG